MKFFNKIMIGLVLLTIGSSGFASQQPVFATIYNATNSKVTVYTNCAGNFDLSPGQSRPYSGYCYPTLIINAIGVSGQIKNLNAYVYGYFTITNALLPAATENPCASIPGTVLINGVCQSEKKTIGAGGAYGT